MKGHFKRNLLIGFSASLLILILSAVASYISINNLLKNAALVNHTHETILGMDAISAALVDAETGQRGYLLTGEDEFLTPYLDARTRAMASYANVKTLTSDNSEQQKDFDLLFTLINDRFKYLDLGIESMKRVQPVNVANLRTGREIMVKVRGLIAVMEERERQLLSARSEAMNSFASFTPPLIIAASLIALAHYGTFLYARASRF